jgi:hypothetical protein
MTIQILAITFVPVLAAIGMVAISLLQEWCMAVDWKFMAVDVVSAATPVLVEEETLPPVVGGQADAMVMDLFMGFMEETPEVPVAEPVAVAEVAVAGAVSAALAMDFFLMVDETPIEEISRSRGALYLEDIQFSGVRSPMVRPSVVSKMVARQSFMEAFVPMEAVQ